MTVTDEISPSERRPTGVGPGERLQAARIQQGLSLDDVASRMHLSISILEALEENDFEEITAPIFVKGYLRAYARIVSLSEDEMIEMYSQYYSEEDPPITSTSNMAPELTSTDARIKWTTYLVIIVLGALLAAWWWNKEQNQETPISLDAQAPVTEPENAGQSEVASSEIAAVSESEMTAESQPESAVESETDSDVEPEAAAETAAPAEVEPEPVEQESVEPEPVVDETPAAAEDTESAAPETEEAAVEEITDSEAAAEAEGGEQVEPPPQIQVTETVQGFRTTLLAPSGSDKLIIVVNADTWADVIDGEGHQMVYDLLRANRTLELTGESPFTVFLGNGHGVEITFNGEDVEVLSRVRSDNTARLKVGD